MKKITIFLLAFLYFSLFLLKAQDRPIAPKVVGTGVFLGETPPLKSLPAVTDEEIAFLKEKALRKAARKVIKPREYPFAETALPKSADAAWQKTMGRTSVLRAAVVNFEGQTTSSFPPDCNGTIGPNYYMQTVNTTYAIYNRSGTLVAGPTNMNLLFNGVSGATCNDGDPLIQYDEQAQRWIAVEFSLCGTNDLMLVAVSSTNDPTGTWYAYSFDVTDTPDYEKIGIWQDGYYMGTNTSSGNDIYVFERSKMLIGAANPQMVAFDNSWRPGTGFLCVPPLDNDGTFAPAGTPGMFIAFNDDAVSGGSDQLWLYELAVNWTTPANSTFVRSQQIAVTAFDSQFDASWNDITQPGTQKLDGVPQVIMNAPQYRNFGDYQTIVCCHTVDVDATNHAGIRWYELRKTGANPWTIRQSGTYAPDASSRWMGSIMLNGSGKIGLAYSIASSSIYPGIRYCGQSSSAYANATGVLDIPEDIIQTGTVAQTTYNRWGDYSLLSVDPTDDETFWFSSEYVKSGGTLKGTKIASFRFGNNPQASTLAATTVTATTATLNGTVNPNSLATNYYFQWGTSVSYGNTTTTTSAGTGTSNVAVSANITGLISGTTYHFRLVAVNTDGTTYGSDFTFLPGAASVTTNSISSITASSASSGGNVVSDGSLSVTARGVCWSTSSNPSIVNSKTTDGSGLGAFTSSITGLAANTTYYVRAYATNSSGTYYGNEVNFNTLSNLPTLTTTAISSISLNSATSGGSITNQGISAVIARGVCWSTSINPTTANSITTNGSGLGAFSSSITGLTSNTTYHVRAYASNSLGTSYGNDIAFTTLCGIFTLPFTESFSSSTLPNCWTIADNQGNGQVWQIGTITNQSPNPTLNANYAYLNSDSLGSGNSQNTDIITPTLNLSTYTSVTLQFNYYFKSYAGSSGNLYYSINNGSSWTLITSITTTSNTNPTAFNQSISAVVGQSAVKFKWNYTATWGYYWAIDDIIITGTTGGCTLPSAAGTITGTANVCQGQNSVVYTTATIADATSYIWTLPSGATGTSSTNSITVNYGTSAISGNITVKGNNTCGSGTSSSLAITVNPLPSTAGTISGNTTLCQGQNNVVYTVPTINNATSYVWTLPSGATGTSSTNSITVNYGSSAISGNITVKGNNSCGDGVSSSLAITVNSLPGASGAISGNTSVCQGQDNVVYTVPSITNATNYSWSLPTGATGTITSNSINVHFLPNAISGNIFVYGNNNCGVGSSSLLAITVNLLSDTARAISGNTTVCQGQNNVVYTVPTITNATSYVWTLPSGATGTSSTNSITVNYGTSAISGNITVKGNNSCGDGVSSSLAITVNSLPVVSGTISGNTTVCQGQNNVVYTVPTITNAINYVWTLPSGATGTSSTNSITVNYGSSAISGNITVKAHNSCGDGNSSILAITVKALPIIIGTISDTICAPGLANLGATASSGTINWYADQNASTPIAFGTSFSPSVTSTTNYYVDATDNGCTSLTRSLVVANVGASPIVIANATTTNICEGIAVTLSGSGTSGVTYTWDNNVLNGVPFNPLITKTYTLTGTTIYGCQNTAIIVVNVDPAPVVNPISGIITLCEGTLNSAYSVALHTYGQPLPPNSGHGTDTDQPDGALNSYAWSYSGTATINPTTNVNLVNLNFPLGSTSGILTVIETDPSTGCSRSNHLTINVNPLPMNAGTISGVNTICVGQNNVVYTVPTIANATTYVWTLPTGATGTSTTNSISVGFGTTAISGDITVKGTNSCGEGAISSLAITVNSVPSTAGVISGNTNTCKGQSGVVYSIPTIPNATTYVWTLPTGATGTSTTNSINVGFGTSAISGDITVKGTNSCGDGVSSSLTITVNPLPVAAGVISGSASVCQGQNNIVYSVLSITNASSYVWTLPTGVSGTSTSNTISVDFGTLATTDVITVKGNNTCGYGIANSKSISVNPLPAAAGIISGLASVLPGQNNITYTIPSINGATSYIWTLPNGANGSSLTNTITVNYASNAVSGNISVKGRNACGDGVASNLAVSVNYYQSVIRLKVNSTANAYTDEAIISYGNASDQSGAEKVFSIITAAPNIYSTKLNKNWSINYLTTVLQHGIVPIGFKAGVNGNYTITASILSTFIPTTYIYLRDLKTKIVTEINNNSTYSYTANSNDSTNRFQLIFSLQKIRWLGNISTDWANIANWSNNTLPQSSDDVILNSWTANQPHVTLTGSNAATCMNLTINPGTSLTIEAGKALTVNGIIANNVGNSGLIIKSDTSGIGSLLHTTANVAATIERLISHTNTDEFHMLAAPVIAQAISPCFNETDGFYVWNEPGFNWIEFADSTNFTLANGGRNFVPGKGYAVSYPNTITKSFTGMLNQGNINIPLTFTSGLYAGWNFVGNPYPSSINWNANSGWNRNVLEDAAMNEKAMWMWNAATGNYGAYISNAAMGTNGVNHNIALSQGFWVKAASSGSLSMTDDVRTHTTATTLKSGTTNSEMIRMIVKGTGNSFSDDIIISFGDQDDMGGAEKMFSLDVSSPSLYSTKFNKKWSINRLSSVANNSTIPIGFKPGANGDYNLSAIGIENFGNVMLEDIKKGIQYNLASNNMYSFDAQTTDSPNRFLLHFNTNSINEIIGKTPSIYYNNQKLIIYNPWMGMTMLNVYDIKGRLVCSYKIAEGNSVQNLLISQGVYFIKIVNEQHIFVEKEIVY